MAPRTGASQTAAARTARKTSTAARKQTKNVRQEAPPSPEIQPKPRPTPTKQLPPHLTQPTTETTDHHDQQALPGIGTLHNGGGDDDGFDGGHENSSRGDNGDDEGDQYNNGNNYGDGYGSGDHDYNDGGYDREGSGGFSGSYSGTLDGDYGRGNGHPGWGHRHTGSHGTVEVDEYESEPEEYDQKSTWQELSFHSKLLTCGVERAHETSAEVDDDSDLVVPFDIPVDGVNHTMNLPPDISWDDFEWEIARRLKTLPSDVSLAYKLASQTKAEMARALVDEKGLEDLMRRCKPFVDGTRKCGRGKEFCVQLFPRITVSKDVPVPTKMQKVYSRFLEK